MYRYSDFDPRFAPNGTVVPGSPKLGARSDEGWYVTFDKIDDAITAKSKAQLFPQNTAKYRLEFASSSIKDKAYVPFGDGMQSVVMEPVTRDYLQNGVGGATQLLVKESEIPVSAIYQNIDGFYQKIWPID